jgi:hypothetical protein
MAVAVPADGHAEGDPAGGVVVANLKLEGVEEFPLKMFRNLSEIDLRDRELVE